MRVGGFGIFAFAMRVWFGRLGFLRSEVACLGPAQDTPLELRPVSLSFEHADILASPKVRNDALVAVGLARQFRLLG